MTRTPRYQRKNAVSSSRHQRIDANSNMQRNTAIAKIVRKPKRAERCDDMIIPAALQDKSDVGDVASDGIVDLYSLRNLIAAGHRTSTFSFSCM